MIRCSSEDDAKYKFGLWNKRKRELVPVTIKVNYVKNKRFMRDFINIYDHNRELYLMVAT